MVTVVQLEELQDLLKEEIEAWSSLAGGPNPDSEEFDRLTADKEILKGRGYFANREAWVAGIRVRKIKAFAVANNISL